ncbi:MAG: MFS transporter [Pseudomonadota bacterium]
MGSIAPLIPLLVAAGILLGGNGVQISLIVLRGAEEGFSAEFIGALGSIYYVGFLIGCFAIAPILRAVGHIRAFAALAALASSSTIMLVLIVDPVAWLILRFFMGICFAGLFTTVESWLNAGASAENRGKVLSIYRLVDMGAVTAFQYLIPLLGISGFTIFGALAIIITLSLVPISLGDRSNPQSPSNYGFDLRRAYTISPIACLGCVSIGLTTSAFRLIGPLYATEVGFSIVDVATFMSAGIVGGAVLQYPLGMLSDRIDRRITLLIATAGAVGAALFLSNIAGTSQLLNYIGIFIFGAFALPLYSLSAAHANDHAAKSGGENDYVVIAAGLIFFFSLGAIAGPLAASIVISGFGPSALFTYISIVHGSLIVLVAWRMIVRAPVSREERGSFAMLLRTSPEMAKMAKKAEKERRE